MPTHPDPHIIALPPRATVNESYQLLNALDAVSSDPQSRVLDASRCSMFGPLGITMLALALERRRSAALPPLDWIPPADDDARAFLDEVGFGRALTNEAAAAPSRLGTLEMRHLRALVPAYTADIAEMIAKRVEGVQEAAAHLVQLCLNELLQNAFEHAGSREGCFVQTRWYAKTGNVRIAVVDGGIGIPAALRRKRISDLQKKGDADVVVAAVTHQGVTSREGTKRGGFGLKLLHEAATERGGRLVVISQTAKVVFTNKGAQTPRSRPFRGTAIEVDFRPVAMPSVHALEVF